MTIEDETTRYVTRYRASAEDFPTPALDREIIAVADRRAAQRRLIRRAWGALSVASIAVIGVGMVWHVQRLHTQATSLGEADYGVMEGITRPYLLQAETTPYSGPGLKEGAE